MTRRMVSNVKGFLLSSNGMRNQYYSNQQYTMIYCTVIDIKLTYAVQKNENHIYLTVKLYLLCRGVELAGGGRVALSPLHWD